MLAFTILGLATWRSWPHLRFWHRFQPLGPNAQGYPEYRHKETGLVFVSLPGGTYWMGAQKDDPNGPHYDPDAEAKEAPVHEVTLSSFLIAKCEVSQAEWERVMSTNPSGFKGADFPVESVSWEDYQEFCRKAGLKLPTEAQWEYACRAGSVDRFCWGDDESRLGEFAWCNANSGLKTHAVGQKQPNAFGLHDVHGNVWEWCEDVYDVGFYSKPEAAGPDPLCTSGSVSRVYRGGSWNSNAERCRSAVRGVNRPYFLNSHVGFRPVYYPLP